MINDIYVEDLKGLRARNAMNTAIPIDLIEIINSLGFKSLTAIQSVAIPKILQHEFDTLIVAPTGSGKTEAAVIPIFYKLAKRSLGLHRGIKVVYVTPLRALNRDMLTRIQNIANKFNLNVNVWHGDTPSSIRRRILQNPPDILITTPESLQIILIKDHLRRNLEPLYAIIIDEAQELISSERGAELAVALERLDNIVGRHVRRILISSPISDIDRLASYFTSGRRYDVTYVKGLKRYSIGIVLTDSKYMNGIFNEKEVYEYLCSYLKRLNECGEQVLVFANTRTTAEELGYSLSTCLGDTIALHHSSLSRDIRESVEAMFKSGELRVVVATSSLELGIDIGGVDVVIQYLSPRQAIKLIQRVGRAGHREHVVSKGIIVLPPIVTELIESVVLTRRAVNELLEKPKYHMNALDVLAHQVVGIVLERDGLNTDEIWRMVSSSTPFSSLTFQEFESIVEFLNSIGMIKCSNGFCKPTKKGLIYYLTTNMIPDAPHYVAKSIVSGKAVGTLDEDFVLTCNEDDIVVLGGRLWRIVSIDTDRNEVFVAPIESSDLMVLPKWLGDIIPVYRNVAREVCAFIRRLCSSKDGDSLSELFKSYDVGDDVRSFLEKNRDRLCAVYPRDDMLVIEVVPLVNERKTLLAFYTCLGSRASEAFSLLLSYILRESLGIPVSYKSHQLGSVMLVGTIIDKTAIANIVKRLYRLSKNSDMIREIVEKELKNTSLFRSHLVSVAKKFGVIGKNVEKSDIKRIVEGLMNIDLIVKETLRELYTDKIDVNELIQYLGLLSNNRLRLKIYVRRNASPYMEEISSLGLFRSLVKQSLVPSEVVIDIAKRRLLDKDVNLFCTSCYYKWTIKISASLNICQNVFSCSIRCPRCGSAVITVVENEEEIPILKKALDKVKRKNDKNRNIKLLSEEENILKKHKKISDFVMSHGLAGIIALQGIGVGIESAKKVIAKAYDLDSLILNIIEQERLYLRTSKYWQK